MPVYVDSLSKILSFVEQLNAADTTPWSRWRIRSPIRCSACAPTKSLDADQHEKYQRNAPRVEAGLYLVPKVIE